MNQTATSGLRTSSLTVELTAAILERGYHGDPPLLASVVAAGLAERIMTISDERPDEVVSWVDQVCFRYSPPKKVTAMLESACSIARGILQYHPETGISNEEFSVLEEGVGEVIGRHREKESHEAAIVAAEEIEIAMAGFLLQLDDADPASAEHSRAVGLWCKRIARRLDLNDEDSIFVSRCGALHDVGKASTPKEILQAPRGLTKEEWVVMRAHTSVGAQMIEDVPQLQPFAPAARWHHERLDGLGYPDKLPAADIPLHIRIVTVADCFNAMIGRRPYRLPMSPNAALEQLITHRETQFDPVVVETMIDVVEHSD